MGRFITMFERISSRFWGFAYVRASTEKKVEAAIRGMGFPCYLPTVPRARMQHSTKIISHIPMISSYVFLCVSAQESSILKKREERIVEIELMRNALLEDEFIRELNILHQCEILASNGSVAVNPGIVAGDHVRIKTGELAGYETVVVSRDDEHNAVIVNLAILNRHVEYRVSADFLKKITE